MPTAKNQFHILVPHLKKLIIKEKKNTFFDVLTRPLPSIS